MKNREPYTIPSNKEKTTMASALTRFYAVLFCILALGLARMAQAQKMDKVTMDFNDTDIRVFIKFISELTGKNFIVDNRVKGRVNIISPGKVTVQEAFRVFESVLDVHGFAAVTSDRVTKIIPQRTAGQKNVETRLDKRPRASEDKLVTQIIPLDYAEADLVKKLLTPMVPKGSLILAYAPTNTLILTDIYSNIKRLLTIVEVIDVKDVGRKITVFPIRNAHAGRLVKTLEVLFKNNRIHPKRPTMDPTPKLVADERTNSVILLANDFDTQKVKTMLAVMDQKIPRGDAKIRVIYLENAKAEQLASVLQSLSGTATKAKSAGKQIAPVISEKVKISHDKSTNSLIIMADKEDFQVLEGIVKKLDIPRPMVYIEALIMEVRDTADFSIGTEWTASTRAGSIDGRAAGAFGGFTASGKKGIGALPQITNNALAPAGGFSLGIMTQTLSIGGITFPSIGAAIKAVKTDENVRIISTPQIMTTDNEEAEINVGENIPYLTRSSSGESDYNNYEYKDVGVTLKITPQISQGRFVRLNIYQKVEKLTNISTVDSSATPTTLKRTAQTTVVVKDAATVVIGGLIGEDLSATDYAVPCLGDVPGLGRLFKSTGRNQIQTNLYIFLTPRIIGNPAEAENLFREKSDHLQSIPETVIPLYKKPSAPKQAKTKESHPWN